MDKEDTISYLERKGKIREKPEVEEEFDGDEEKFYTKTEKEEIRKVMKEGKIYGDPLVEMDF